MKRSNGFWPVIAMAILLCLVAIIIRQPSPGVPMANDFSTDSACKALWRFESAALLEDSIGSNDLTNDFVGWGEDAISTTAAGTFREGSGAINVLYPPAGYPGYVGITDANLDAGFPLKNGDTSKLISVVGWFYSTTDTGDGYDVAIFEKYHQSNSGKRTITLSTLLSSGDLRLRVYHSSGNELVSMAAGITKEKWYHFGMAVDGVSKTYLVRLYDLTAGTAETFSGSFGNELLVTDGPVMIGRYLDGYIDELVVFDELKDADDFDAIRGGTYGGTDNSVDRWGWVDGPAEPVISVIPVLSMAWRDIETAISKIPSIESAWKMIPPAPRWSLPSAQPRREVFICTLRKTGLSDVEVPLASLQMRRRDGNPTMISCVIPDAETYLDYAEDREDGEIIIYAGSITEDGTRHLSELERVSLDSISYDIGVQSSSLVVSGYRTETNINPRPVDIEGVTYYGLQADGKRRIRAKINQFLRPGDTAIYGDGSFVVDQIYVFIEPKNAWMEAAGL
jgi:hypothetical protein